MIFLVDVLQGPYTNSNVTVTPPHVDNSTSSESSKPYVPDVETELSIQ